MHHRMGMGLIVWVLGFQASAIGFARDSETDFSVLPKRYQTSTDPFQQQWLIYDFMWRSFIALNWPNMPLKVEGTGYVRRVVGPVRGFPDPKKKLMSGSREKRPLTVWETYKVPYEVFPRPELWDKSGNWNSMPIPHENKPHENKPHKKVLNPLKGLPIEPTDYASDTKQPYFYPFNTGPLKDQSGNLVYYQVAVNRSFFRYIRYFGYYNRNTQLEAVRNYIQGQRGHTAFQRPPFGNPAETGPGGYLHDLPESQQVGFVDVKAAWRVLDPQNDHPSRYLHREMLILVEKSENKFKWEKKHMGLVGLHILRWTPNGYDPKKGIDGAFVAATFEQIDNVTANIDQKGHVVEPTFNDGKVPTPEQLEYGFAGATPTTRHDKPVSIYRARSQAIPAEVRLINNYYQNTSPVKSSVLRYYQLIGTQNKHLGSVSFKTPADRETNGPQGPITGVITNTNNLINTTLESYTQKNFACILCHSKARPFGIVSSKKQMFGVPDKAFQDDHFKILTFLLLSAQKPSN